MTSAIARVIPLVRYDRHDLYTKIVDLKNHNVAFGLVNIVVVR